MSDDASSTPVLAGDIGGTKTNLGFFGTRDGRPHLLEMESYASRDAESLEDLIERFMTEYRQSVSAACFGIAGPVMNGVSKTTNLPWIVSERNIRERFLWKKVCLINDLAATATAVAHLETSELHELNPGSPDPRGNRGLVAPGTGLGMALLVCVDGRLHPISSEGGHVDFAPSNEKEMALLRHLKTRWGHVSVERVASGPGLSTIYMWLRECRMSEEPVWLSERMTREDASRVISEVGLAGQDPLCAEALEMFVSVLGAVAGNLALTGLTTGGIYLGGGISPKIVPKLEERFFLENFAHKGRFRELMLRIPVRVILNDKAALFGAACTAFDLTR